MQGEDRPNIKTQLIIGALKFAEFPDHISIDYDSIFFRFFFIDTPKLSTLFPIKRRFPQYVSPFIKKNIFIMTTLHLDSFHKKENSSVSLKFVFFFPCYMQTVS